MDRYNRKVNLLKSPRLGSILLMAGLVAPGLASAATLTVDSTADVIANDGNCGLREAIINANNNDQSGSTDCLAGEALPVIDHIVFDANTNNTPFVLDLTGINDNAAATGDLDITESLIIEGNGTDSVTEVDGNATDRVFEIRNGAEVEMSRIAITNGGGVTIGAGISLFNGRLDLVDAGVFSNNISSGPGNGTIRGAGIRTAGDLSLTRVSVLGNDMQGFGNITGQGAGIYADAGSTLSVVDSLIKGNTIDTEDGSASGAGLYHQPADAGAIATISGTLFSGNRAISSGEGGAAGGAINHQTGTLTISSVIFSNNTARRTSTGGGSIASGGAINAFAPVDMSNTTVSGNRSESIDFASGGGLALSDDAELNNVTITDNQVSSDPGETATAGGLSGNSGVTISNTIIAGNGTTNAAPDCSGTFNSMGYNLIGDNSNCGFVAGTGDQVGDVTGGGAAIDPLLAALADNGGAIEIDGHVLAMESHDLLPGSPAIDTGDPNIPGSGGTCETTDQRGEPRPADGNDNGSEVCDIGAVERGAETDTTPPEDDGSTGSGSSGGGSGGALPTLLPLMAGLLVWRRRKRAPLNSTGS